MKVLVVTHYFAVHCGGIELVAEQIAVRLARGHTITWIASNTIVQETPRLIRYVPVGAVNIVERLIGIPYPIWFPAGLARLWREIRETDVVMLHDALYMGNFAAYLFAHWQQKPVVVIQHIGEIPYRNPVLRLMMRIANRLITQTVLLHASQIVYISERTRRFFTRYPGVLIYNGIDADIFHPSSERDCIQKKLGFEAPVYLFVGRFVEKKGLLILRKLAESMPEATWVFAGWGPMDPADWGLANVRVERDRRGASLTLLYQAADVLVLPSVGEGFPLVIQEALACGLPVLCSDETKEGDRQAPLICERVGADVDETASRWREKLKQIANEHFDREALAQFARSRWSWERAIQQYGGILSTLIDQ